MRILNPKEHTLRITRYNGIELKKSKKGKDEMYNPSNDKSQLTFNFKYGRLYIHKISNDRTFGLTKLQIP